MAIVVPVGTGTSVGTGVTTYTGLVASVGTWLNRSDLTTRIPDFITLLEARLNRILRTPEMETTFTFSTAVSVALPTDFLESRALYLDTDPRRKLDSVTLATLRTNYACQTTGKPEVYAISGANILFGPAPDDTYSAVLTYYQKLVPLSADNETNWLIVTHPDVYLWGALLMAEAFIWDDPRLAIWKQSWDEAIGELINQSNAKRFGGAPLRLRASVHE